MINNSLFGVGFLCVDFSFNFMQIPCFSIATTLLLFIGVLLVVRDNFIKEFDDDAL